MNEAFGLPLRAFLDSDRWSMRIQLPEMLPPAWAHCGLTAEMLGDLYSRVLARAGADGNEARHGIVYLCNELLENAVKFRHPQAGSIELAIACEDGVFEIHLCNHAEPVVAAGFRALLEQIVGRDPGELLLERIEANAMSEEENSSGLGILTMMSDYGVEFGWQLDGGPDGDLSPVAIHTYARLRLITNAGA